MKKLIVILTALSMLGLVLAGCAKKEDTETTTPETTTTGTTTGS